MPDQSPIGAINNLGASLISGTANAWMQGRENKYQRAWTLDMYNRQRADALSDWDKQNFYNSPQEQMKRLKAAGLNPNLVYGNGATATSSQSVRSSSMSGDPQFRRSEGSTVGMSFDQYFDAQVKQAQVDNLKAQNDVIKQEAALKAFNLGRGKSMLPWELRSAELSGDVKINEISQMMNRWEIDQLTIEVLRSTKSDRIQKIAEEVMLLAAQRAKTSQEGERLRHAAHLLMQDEELRQFDIELRSKNIQPGTPPWYRAWQMFWDNILNR